LSDGEEFDGDVPATGPGVKPGERDWLRAPGIVRSFVTRVDAEAPHEEISERKGLEPPLTAERFRAILADAVDALRHEPLGAPATAAFNDGFGHAVGFATRLQEGWREPPGDGAAVYRATRHLRPSPEQLRELPALAERLLVAYLEDDRSSEDYPRPRRHTEHVLALSYAEAVLRQRTIAYHLRHLTPDRAPFHAALPPADRERIDAFTLYAGSTGRFLTLDDVLQRWERLVVGLENRNRALLRVVIASELSLRDRLHTVAALVGGSHGETLRRRIGELDARYAAATEPASASLLAPLSWKPQGWWWFRTPRAAP